MEKSFFISFLFIFLCSCSKERKDTKLQIRLSDSINYYFSKFESQDLSNDERRNYLNKATVIIEKSNNSLKIRELNYDLISKYYEIGSWKSYMVASKILLKNSLAANDKISLAKSYRSFGNYYNQTQRLDSAFYYYTKTEKIYKEINDFEGYSTILLKKGSIQFDENDYLGADLSLSKSLVALKRTNENEKKHSILILLGLNANQLKEYSKSIGYFNEALNLINEKDLDNKQYLESVCLSNIGLVYQNLKKHKIAISYFKKALKYNKLENDYPIAYSNIIDNLGYSNLQDGDLKSLPELFLKSLKIRKDVINNSGIVISEIHLSEYFLKINNKKKSLEFANLALEQAKKNKNPIDLLFSLKQASVVDNERAAKYSDDYLRITDSLQIAERKSKDRFTRISLETDEIILEKDSLEDKNRNLLYIFVVTFILVALLFVVRAQRARTRELLFKQNQQKANEEIFNLMMSQQSIIDESRDKEKKRLAQDLHDGVLGRMFGLRLNLDSLNSSTDEGAMKKRHELLNELKIIEQDIREISHDLNREKLVLINNFVSIVHNLLEEQKSLHEANVEYHIETKIDWDKIGNVIKINMYRILQEGLQNINKYASAGVIKVDISGDKENVYLKVQDDGIGFDVNKKSKGIGMQNMISRTNDCHGIINITSKKGEGTKIIITIPIQTKKLIEEEV
ncbi:tetratricopeptide repeat protein [Flavobacterium sp.]|uniref:tetratricopeptide repeat-containing sensor histidine kinase n=1 Tax=Flavobacterium sp. TaxID=239 RepID=UPI002487F538|nr:tetratricopeptide repeat protein [Flavobacterium sp.]MDI1316737.1 tetratricopeptide repeat protein [Flavobacterium sp.]